MDAQQDLRALWLERQTCIEGMVYATTAPVLPYDSINPLVGIGYGFSCTGMSSYKRDFARWEQCGM